MPTTPVLLHLPILPSVLRSISMKILPISLNALKIDFFTALVLPASFIIPFIRDYTVEN